MRFEVTLRGARGEREIVFVDAADGDDAAAKAFKPHMVVLSVQPAPKPKAKAKAA